jgi:serine protease AprX
MRSVPARRVSRRLLGAGVAASVVAAVLVGVGPVPAVVGAGASEPPARPLTPNSGIWSASNWTTSTGTPVTDVAKVIGSDTSGLDGTGVGIALIDTGVAPVPGLPASQIVNGPDLSFDSQAPHLRHLDEYGHGTHLAGIIVGNDTTTGLKGIAPKAKLTSIKVGAAGGVVDITQVIAAVDWVVEHRTDDPANPIKIITLAYGTDAIPNWNSDPLHYAVENAFRNGILVLVAGGNGGSSPNKFNNPAMSQFVMSVGSADTKGTLGAADDTLSTFTSTSTMFALDVVAPGEGIVSARVPGSGIDVAYPGARVGENLFRGSGSSQATAVVAGAAALLYQKAPTANPYEIESWISDSTKPLTGSNAARARGELSIANALKVSKPSLSIGGGNPSTGLGSIETARGNIHVVHNNATLSGVKDIFGSFSNSTWTNATKNKTAWNGGLWMGKRLTGDGWTGTSWASKTWASATWTAPDWAGQAWADSSWSGRYWAGRYWAAGDWSGRYWASSTWQANNYSTKNWSSYSWY